MEQVRVLLVSGSTRPGSSNTRALQALHGRVWPGVTAVLYESLRDLPDFVPGTDPQPRAVRDLLDRIASADAVLFSTPEYAGGLPGSLKNLLDWKVGGGRLSGEPVAWLDVANPGRGGGAHAQLRTVLGHVGARVLARVHLTLASDPGDAAAVAVHDAQLVTAMAETATAIRKEVT